VSHELSTWIGCRACSCRCCRLAWGNLDETFAPQAKSRDPPQCNSHNEPC
jgi:hypothetical protein